MCINGDITDLKLLVRNENIKYFFFLLYKGFRCTATYCQDYRATDGRRLDSTPVVHGHGRRVGCRVGCRPWWQGKSSVFPSSCLSGSQNGSGVSCSVRPGPDRRALRLVLGYTGWRRDTLAHWRPEGRTVPGEVGLELVCRKLPTCSPDLAGRVAGGGSSPWVCGSRVHPELPGSLSRSE